MRKKAVSLVLALALVLGMIVIPESAGAKDYQDLSELKKTFLAIDVEAYNLGLPHIIEPSLVAVKEGTVVKDQLDTLSENKGFGTIAKDTGWGAYLAGVEGEDISVPSIPGYLKTVLEKEKVTLTEPDHDGFLSEMEYTTQSGWMFTVNHVPASASYSGQPSEPGTTVRFVYSLYGWGADLGVSTEWAPAYYTEADKTALIFDLAAMNSYYGNSVLDNVYEDALKVANNPYATQKNVDAQVKTLEDAINYKIKNGIYPSDEIVKSGYGETFWSGFAPGNRPVVLSVGNKCFLSLPDKAKKTVYSSKGIVTVSATGQVTPKKAGSVTATITLKDDTVKTYSFIVEQPVLPKKKIEISVGDTVRITDYITGLTHVSPDYYIANNPDKLYVDHEGRLTAEKKGSASVQVWIGAKKYVMSFKVV